MSTWGAGAEFLNPFTQAESDLLAARRKALEDSYRQMFGQPIPDNTPGGAFKRDLQSIGGSLAMLPYGLAALNLDAQKGFVDAGRNVGDYFSGTGYKDPRGFQPVSELPSDAMRAYVASKVATGQGEAAINPGAFPLLDGETNIQGTPLPTPTEFKPSLPAANYDQANARLDAARPQPQPPKGDKLGAYFEGAALAAGKIDPRTPPIMALGQILSGAAAGGREFRLKQEEAELRDETLQRQYELMRAGVEEHRATAEAQAAYNRTKIEMDALQTNFENAWRTAAAKQPSVQSNADGSMVITTRGEDGQINIKRVGFDDALRTSLAIAQAKNMGGKSGEVGMVNRILQNAGPEMVMGYYINTLIGKGMDTLLLPNGSSAQQAYEKDNADYLQQLSAQGLDGKTLETLAAKNRFDNLMKLIMGNKALADHALYMVFGIEPGAPRKPSPEVPASSGSFFQNNLLPTQ